MVSHFAVKLELNKGANKMAIFGKGGYDSPENEKEEKKKKLLKKRKRKKNNKNLRSAQEKELKKKARCLLRM